MFKHFKTLLLITLLLSACTDSTIADPVQKAKARVIQVSTHDVANNHLHKDLVIDVRESDEIITGMIPGAIHIPVGQLQSEFPKYLQSLGNDSSQQTIVLYCRSGNRSAVGADALQKLGFSNIVSMQGGIKAWVAENAL
ncbi:MAG: rhodanese-like domain-containing protein [Gammaproteobacteria bacterium]|nr:rhodanese-like domain-containing protein [Gammaproteobacteria bacterium]NNM13336.1 rhodanese-like domain-containing protein [Gammaproteobacteria bacterium]